MFTKIFATVFKTVTLLIVLALLTPVAYFAYRSIQPMTLPEFHGLTYIQFIQWRTMAYASLEAKYAREHPDADGTPQNGYIVNSFTCEGELRIITFTASVFQSWNYAFWSWRNDQKSRRDVESELPDPQRAGHHLEFHGLVVDLV